jgi:hypothetical protein
MLILKNGLTVNNDLITFNRNHFSGIFINKILDP